MLDELTVEANEESFVIVLQHGGNDVTWKRSIIAPCASRCMHKNLRVRLRERERARERERVFARARVHNGCMR